LARAKSRRGQGAVDRFEAESMDFHEKLRQAYRALAAEEPQRCIMVDGRAPRDVVADRIWSVVRERLRPKQVGVAETTGP
jgi:dTMP kinase